MAKKQTELTGQELALLVNKLQMPLIARDYMDAGLEPESDTQYALHELMGNLEPSTALLCAAMTLQEIAQSHDGLTYLNEVCSDIIHKYGPEVLHGSDIGAKDLSPLYEDLEQILELMEMCRMSFEIVRPETLGFLNIMIPQLESQIIIIDEAMRVRSKTNSVLMFCEKIKQLPETV